MLLTQLVNSKQEIKMRANLKHAWSQRVGRGLATNCSALIDGLLIITANCFHSSAWESGLLEPPASDVEL